MSRLPLDSKDCEAEEGEMEGVYAGGGCCCIMAVIQLWC